MEVAPKDGGPANRSPGKGVAMDDGRHEEGSSCSEDLESSSPVLSPQTSSQSSSPASHGSLKDSAAGFDGGVH